MAKKYIVRLTEDERSDLESLIHTGKVAAHKRLYAEILLKADIGELGEKWPDNQNQRSLWNLDTHSGKSPGKIGSGRLGVRLESGETDPR